MDKQSAVDFEGVYLILAVFMSAVGHRKFGSEPAAAPGSRFLFISLFILSFLACRGADDKMVAGGDEIRAIHHYLLGTKKIHNNVI